MNRLTLLIFSMTTWLSLAQDDRFQKTVFADCSIERDVIYGKATTQGGELLELTMDVYQPVGDTMKERPVIVLAHGGYFFFGEKEDFQLECEQLAKAGFVAVSINYRLIDVYDDSFYVAKMAVIDAVADMKAAVRFFYKDADKQNKYRVDTDNIFIGGYSAGAIASLHYAYANSVDDVKLMGGEMMLKYVNSIGGLEGKSGNPGYPTKVKGVINISGALFNADMLDKDEPLLFSIHGTDDEIVPYKEGLAGTTKVTTQGSGMIHMRADKIGLENYLLSIRGGDHYVFLDCEQCLHEMLIFLNHHLKK